MGEAASARPTPPKAALASARSSDLAHVINATGTVIHTNLGGAPLAPEALAAVSAVAGGYCNLEYDLAGGLRGSRNAAVEPLLCSVTGARAAVAVNNGAAAMLLALSALAAGTGMLVLASPAWRGVVEVLAECLDEVGLGLRADYSKADADPPGWDLKLVWYFDWSPQYPVGVVHREFFGKDGLFLSGPADDRFDALYARLLATPHQPTPEELVREIERDVFDQAKALFLFSPFNLVAVSERVELVAYDTCMSELAETKIRSTSI